jgi:8-oxo-dGTP pyrophosphatase MutT (NUDIX family)
MTTNLPLRSTVRVIIRKGDEICLCIKKKNGHIINYNVPGGGVEEGHSEEQTAIKEALEEVGLRITNVKPLNIRLARQHPMGDAERNATWSGTDTAYFLGDFERVDMSLHGTAGDALYWEWKHIKEAIRLVEEGPRDPFTATKIKALQAVARMIAADGKPQPAFLNWK